MPAHDGDGVLERDVDVERHARRPARRTRPGCTSRGSRPLATTWATMSRLLTVPARLPSLRQSGTESSPWLARKQAASAAVSVVRRTSMSPHMTSRMVLMATSHCGPARVVGPAPPPSRRGAALAMPSAHGRASGHGDAAGRHRVGSRGVGRRSAEGERLVGSARTSPTSRRKSEAACPSTSRWSKARLRVTTSRRATSPSNSHGRRCTAPTARMAASPGLRMGTPASTPKTPTLVSGDGAAAAGRPACERASRAVRGQVGERRGQLAQRELLRVLDVGHDQPVRARHGDAEVDVVLRHDLVGRPRPTTS